MNEHFTFSTSPPLGLYSDFNLLIGSHLDGHNYVAGSGVFIANNLAITARHVLVSIFETFNHVKVDLLKADGAGYRDRYTSVLCIQQLMSGRAAIWALKNAFLANNTDIAYMNLIPVNEEATNIVWHFPEFEMITPPIGSKVSAYGYCKMTGQVKGDTTIWKTESAHTTGAIIDVYHEKRDNGIYKFPVSHTNAEFPHGMSGAGVWNAEGRLFGLVSGSLGKDGPDTEHVSYIAHLWPSLTTPIHNLTDPTKMPAYNLFNSTFMRVSNIDKVKLGIQPGQISLNITSDRTLTGDLPATE